MPNSTLFWSWVRVTLLYIIHVKQYEDSTNQNHNCYCIYLPTVFMFETLFYHMLNENILFVEDIIENVIRDIGLSMMSSYVTYLFTEFTVKCAIS